MVKIYKGSITKDQFWMALITAGLGALLVIIPLIVCYLWVNNVTSEGTKLSDIALNVGFFIGLFLIGSGACFYLVWRGTHERVLVDDGALTYVTTFFTKKIPALDIEKIMIFDNEQPVVIYDSGDDLKRQKLPSWKSNDYMDSLIADLKRMNPNIGVLDLRAGAAGEAAEEQTAQ